MQLSVQLTGGLQVPAEGLLDHDPVAAMGAVQPNPVQLINNRKKILRPDRQVEDDVFAKPHSRAAEDLEEPIIGPGVIEITAQILEACRETGQDILIHVPADGRADGARKVLTPVCVIPGPAAQRHEHQVVVQPPGGIQFVERGQQLHLREIAGGPENDEMTGAGTRIRRHSASPSRGTTACPPNPLRIIDSILLP
jgi:hypothetical protein